ncbi:MAG: radical SAM protein [bacterium]
MPLPQILGTLRALADPRQVGYLIFYVTNRCNFSCDFCFYHEEIAKGRKDDELAVDEIERLAAKLGPLAQLSLTGGEPFIRPELIEIATAFLTHTHARWVTIPTNGWFSERVERALDVLTARFPTSNFRVVLSVDGIESQHDVERQAPGSWQRLCETYAAVDRLRRRRENLVLDANTVYSSRTQAHVLAILRALDERFAFDNLSLTYTRGRLRDRALEPTLHEPYQRARQLILERARRDEGRALSSVWRAVDDVSHELLARVVFEDRFAVPCVAGRKLVVVGETGDVFPCEVLGTRVGNVRDVDYDLHRLLAAPLNERLVRWIRDSRCKCSFECAHAANTVWNRSAYPAIGRAWLRNALRRTTHEALGPAQAPGT